MLDRRFVYLGVAISLAGGATYIWSTARGVTRPNQVSWFMWAVIPVPAFVVELKSGVGLQSLTTLAAIIDPLIVFVVSFVNEKAVWRIGKADWACGALALAGTAVWATTKVGAIGLAASLGADLTAGIPTFVKSWRQPESESVGVYIGGALGAGVTVLTVRRFTAPEVAFPLLLVVVGLAETLLIGGKVGPRLARLQARG